MMLRNLLILGLFIVGLAGEPLSISIDDITIKLYGQSGKFSVSNGKDKGEDDAETVTIEFDSIKEVDADGNEVATTGPESLKHSFKKFGSLNFSGVSVLHLDQTTYKGISTWALAMSVVIPGPNATLFVPIYLFSGSGLISLCEDEQIDILKGMVKYNIQLSNWNFCKAGSPGCTKAGKFVDLVMTVKNKGKLLEGKKEKKENGTKRMAQKFYFGKTNSIAFPSVFTSDGSCAEMGEGYPKLETKGSKYSVTFRFPVFNSTVIYDPAVNVMDTAPSSPTTPTRTTGCSKPLPSLGVALLLCVFVRLFF